MHLNYGILLVCQLEVSSQLLCSNEILEACYVNRSKYVMLTI